MNSKFLEISNLDKAFPSPKGDVTIVKGFNLTLREGEFVSLIGHSGCGKSTVLSIVAGLANATAGGIIAGEITRALAKAYGWGEPDPATRGSPRRAPNTPAAVR